MYNTSYVHACILLELDIAESSADAQDGWFETMQKWPELHMMGWEMIDSLSLCIKSYSAMQGVYWCVHVKDLKTIPVQQPLIWVNCFVVKVVCTPLRQTNTSTYVCTHTDSSANTYETVTN